ncbi:MAG: DoxX family protein [Verrucomicrobiota bacterium]|nr:DoxX family protein [Verrucomicrobiota bacterium]
MAAKIGAALLLLLRLGLGALFVYAGAVKAWDTQQFALDVQHYELTPWTVSILIAVYLPWLEICSGLAVIARRLHLGALVALNGLLILFLGAIISAWARGLDIACGCFGRSKEAMETNYPEVVGRDLALLAGLLVLGATEWRRARARQQKPEAGNQRPEAGSQ